MFLGNINTFGGTSKESLKNSHKLLKYEKENDEAMFIFLSDLWLDDNKVRNTYLNTSSYELFFFNLV